MKFWKGWSEDREVMTIIDFGHEMEIISIVPKTDTFEGGYLFTLKPTRIALTFSVYTPRPKMWRRFDLQKEMQAALLEELHKGLKRAFPPILKAYEKSLHNEWLLQSLDKDLQTMGLKLGFNQK